MGAVIQLDPYRSQRQRVAQPQRVRARLNWKPRDIQDALASADGGSLAMAAELCERLMTDPVISGVLSTRTLGMLGLPLALEGDEQQVAALSGTHGIDSDTDGDWHTLHPENESAQIVGWGIVLGVGLGQRVPLPRAPGARQLHRLRCWHPRDLRWEELQPDDPRRENGQSIRWLVRVHGGLEQEITPGDGEWVLYLPYGSQRPWALATWRALAFAWILKVFAVLDRARHLEVLGSPIRKGKAPPGATEAGRTKWQGELRNLSRDSAVVLPDGYDIELLEATGNSWEMYTSQISWADTAFAITLAGQSVTTNGSTGFSDGKTQDGIRRELIRFTSKTWAVCLRGQSLRPWAEVNFGTKNAPLPKWDAESSEDRLARARSMISLGEAVQRLNDAFAASGKRVDTDTLAQQYGLPMITLPPAPAAPTIAMTPSDVVNFITVNEVRASSGLEPLKLPNGDDDPAGFMNAALFKALNEAKANPPAPVPVDNAGDGSETSRAVQQREQDAAVSP